MHSGTDGDQGVLMADLVSENRLREFQAQRSDLVALAYRMLGDFARAEDMVQEAWLRWQATTTEVNSPRAYLLTTVTRLCLNELDSAHHRREESRSDRLPEPVDLEAGGMPALEQFEQVSMAFLVVLQRLTPGERAVFLLHDAFDFDHEEIAQLMGKSTSACRKLLERARRGVRDGKRMLEASVDEHRRLLRAFIAAATGGDVAGLVALLADDAVLVSDGGPSGSSVGGFRNLPKPLEGASRVAAFVAAASSRGARRFTTEERELNGRPAIVFYLGERPAAALLLGVADGKIRRVFFHADADRLRHVGKRRS
jgi:RNA polymerase sigma-70 factor, ECF subfamily